MIHWYNVVIALIVVLPSIISAAYRMGYDRGQRGL